MSGVIHIGAGNIGRGFIVPVLKLEKNIDEFIFLDINKDLVEKIKHAKKYNVLEIDKTENKIEINDVDAFTFDEISNTEFKSKLNNINLITISIGQNNLTHIVKNFKYLLDSRDSKSPLVVICCENGYRVSSYFKKLLTDETKSKFENVYFVDAVVDRIVPNQTQNGLDISVEKYWSWIIDASQWPAAFSKISAINYSKDLDAEINKKICLLNGVHASISWKRYQEDKFEKIATLQEAIKIPSTLQFVNDLMNEIVDILVKQFKFDKNYLIEYKQQIIQRFENPGLIDDLYRIGRNPITKLQVNERILAPLLYAKTNNLESKLLLESFNNGLNYWYVDDKEGQELKHLFSQNSKKEVIQKIIKDITEEQINMIL